MIPRPSFRRNNIVVPYVPNAAAAPLPPLPSLPPLEPLPKLAPLPLVDNSSPLPSLPELRPLPKLEPLPALEPLPKLEPLAPVEDFNALFLYKDLREKWKHEDELVNQRTARLLTAQAFFLTAHGALIAYRSRIDTRNYTVKNKYPESPSVFDPLLLSGAMLPVIGWALCMHCGKGLRAAYRAMAVLQLRHAEIKLAIKDEKKQFFFPDLDVMPQLSNTGNFATIHLPTVFLFCWWGISCHEAALFLRVHDVSGWFTFLLCVMITLFGAGVRRKYFHEFSSNFNWKVALARELVMDNVKTFVRSGASLKKLKEIACANQEKTHAEYESERRVKQIRERKYNL